MSSEFYFSRKFKYAWVWRFLITWGFHRKIGPYRYITIGFYDKDCEENIWQVGV
jgi:hypothetical protein